MDGSLKHEKETCLRNTDVVTGEAHPLSGEVPRKARTVFVGCAVTGLCVLPVLGISASLIGCGPAGSPQTTANSAPQAQISNAALEEKIKTNLNTDEQLRAANLDVKANVDRNEVTLSGTVESESVKTRAVESAKSAQAGLNVTSKIAVDQNCCGSGAMRGPKEGMRGMKGTPGGRGRQ